MNVCTNSWQICNWRCHHSLTKFVPSHHYCAIASNWPIRNKFGRNRSKRGWDMAIFRFSTMADCWNLKFLTVGTLKRVELHNRTKFVEVAQTTAEIWPFYDFQDGGRRHLGFLKLEIFNGQDAQKGWTAPSYQILSKSLKPRLRYGHFTIFKMAAAAILDL